MIKSIVGETNFLIIVQIKMSSGTFLRSTAAILFCEDIQQ